MVNLLLELGLQSPVYWFVSNKQGGGAWETDLPDMEYAKEHGLGVFFAVNEMGDVVNKKGNRRHEKNAIRPTAFFVDFDKDTKECQAEIISSFPIKPTAIIESGRGYHVYWILSDKIDWRTWSFIQTSIAKKLGGDTACSDPARLMRLPGSWHTKREHVLVTVKEFTGNKCLASDFIQIFPVPAPRVYSKDRRPGRRIYLPVVTLSEGSRHPTLKQVAAKVFNGVLPSEIESRSNQLKAWYATSCMPLKSGWEEEVDDVIQWFVAREI